MLRTLLVVFFLLFVAARSWSAHLVGGEIYYECLGGDQYRITLKVYRDCYTITGADFDNPANIAIYDDDGDLIENITAPFSGSQQLEVTINDPCLQAPPDVCVEEAIYTVTTTLPYLEGGYHISYQRCCRNPTIVNLQNPEDLGSTYYVHISEEALNSCNSNPRYNSFPPLALCTGEPLVYDHSAFDPDGDQLVYSLCTPYHGGDQINPMPVPPLGPPYAPIIWSGIFSDAYPLDASPQLSIDPVTGVLTGTPTQIGQYVVGVCVEEYRNGQLISVNKRDFQFNVVSCESNIAAIIPPQPIFHDPCDGLTVDFGNQSVNAQYYHWDFGVDFLVDDTSNIEAPLYTYPDTGLYSVQLIANPGFVCADTTYRDVVVYNDVTVSILLDGEQCFDANSINFAPIGDFGSGATFYWEFENAQPATSTDMSPQGITFNSVGEFEVSVTVTEAACTDQNSTTVEMYPRPEAYYPAEPISGCAPLGILYEDSSYAGTPYQAIWEFSDGTTLEGERVFHTFTEEGFYDVSLTIWTTSGCVDTSTFFVPNAAQVFPVPTALLEVEPDTQFIFEPTFEFTGSSNGVDCVLFPGDGSEVSDQMPNCTFEHFYTDTGNFQAIMYFQDQNGCMNSDSVRIRVEPEVRFWVPNAFTPNDDRINDTWGPKAFGFSEYEIWVYDRWGKLMFNSTNPFEKWNGTFKNKSNHPPVLGVYSYRILARSLKNTVIKESGHVTILK
jgi:gliding motility-associated-like protein